MHWLIPLSAMIFAELVANFIAKRWSLEGGAVLFLLAIVGFIVVNVFWLISLRYGVGLARGAAYFGIVSAMLATILGVLHFKETLTITQWVGLAMGFLAIGFLA